MAGAFTHFMVCEEAKKQYVKLDKELYRLLNKHSEFLFLGAASPDLPYLCFKTGAVNWADVMHYEKTNSIALSGYEEIKTAWKKMPVDEAVETQWIWLLGFVSHLVIDATIHPIVQAIVGPYAIPANREPHRICEMTQDSLIFNAIKGVDIRYAKYIEILKFCGDSDHFDTLMDFWKWQASMDYRNKGEEPHPELWFDTYSLAIDAAAARSELLAFFRHLGGEGSYVYKTKEEILNTYPGNYRRFFSAIKLPGNKTGNFKKDGFDRAVDNVIAAWNALHSGLISGGITATNVIKPWNLDTGVDMSTADNQVTYWT
jgi:hypothetical protein